MSKDAKHLKREFWSDTLKFSITGLILFGIAFLVVFFVSNRTPTPIEVGSIVTHRGASFRITEILPDYTALAVRDMQIGDTVSFGDYSWRVMEIQDDNTALIVTERIILRREFHGNRTTVLWVDSDIRRFLNGTFFNGFSEDDRNQIVPNTSSDMVFLLTYDDANRLFDNNNDRRARLQGRFHRNRSWWLSSTVQGQDQAVIVHRNGSIRQSNGNLRNSRVNDSNVGIRPAVLLDIGLAYDLPPTIEEGWRFNIASYILMALTGAMLPVLVFSFIKKKVLDVSIRKAQKPKPPSKLNFCAQEIANYQSEGDFSNLPSSAKAKLSDIRKLIIMLDERCDTAKDLIQDRFSGLTYEKYSASVDGLRDVTANKSKGTLSRMQMFGKNRYDLQLKEHEKNGRKKEADEYRTIVKEHEDDVEKTISSLNDAMLNIDRLSQEISKPNKESSDKELNDIKEEIETLIKHLDLYK